MYIQINNTKVDVRDGDTILELSKKIGINIPSMCYAKGYKHTSSCMVCAVKDCNSGQIVPSCTTIPYSGMKIDTESEEVKHIRTQSLELLLSDHRADCIAPCTIVCPAGLDIDKMLRYYDMQQYQNAFYVISSYFKLPQIECNSCKAPCEKACKRKSIDKAVTIKNIVNEIVEKNITTDYSKIPELKKIDKEAFNSRLGLLIDAEKEMLKKTIDTASNCLHCSCAGISDCKLRLHATNQGIKRLEYNKSSATVAMKKQYINGTIWYEQSKCISCGLCVYNSNNGFTFSGRGFDMQVVLPTENINNIDNKLADICPTGAIYYDTIKQTK